MGPTHRLTGASAGLALAVALSWSPLQAAAGMTLSVLVSGGRLSPDADEYPWWHLLDRLLPDEWLGHGGPLRHRGLSHWWGLPAAVGAAVPLVPPSLRWVVLALLAGWCSHLVGDFLFGKPDRWADRGPGIPLAPWWGHVGLGLDTGGRLELAVRALLLPAVLCWQALQVMHATGQVSQFVAGLLPP